MSILINRDTKIIVQGITGAYGRNQARHMKEYGSQIVAGISPGKSGQTLWDIPIYDTVAEAAARHSFTASTIYVPPTAAFSAAMEAMEAGVKLVMIAAEGMPLHECMKLKKIAERRDVWLVGPNTIGMITPGECLMGSLASSYATKGNVGIVTRGGTIAVELIRLLSKAGIGQTTCVGAGGDRVIGKNPIDYLKLFEQDEETKAVLLVGEIGGLKENQCAEFISKMKKPVVAYILGRTAPAGARMGHIGAIISKGSESFEAKQKALREAGAIVVNTPWEAIAELKKI